MPAGESVLINLQKNKRPTSPPGPKERSKLLRTRSGFDKKSLAYTKFIDQDNVGANYYLP